jgi:hypothetical protein
MTTTIKTQNARLMTLSLVFTFFLFINNAFATAVPDSTKSCSTDKKFAVSKTDSTNKKMKGEDMGGGMHKEMKMGMNMNEGMHKEMMEKKDSTSSCKNKETMQESPSGKDMAMADCKMKDGEKKDCKMKDDEKKECKMRDEEKKDCKMKEDEKDKGKAEHESHHKGESEKSVN